MRLGDDELSAWEWNRCSFECGREIYHSFSTVSVSDVLPNRLFTIMRVDTFHAHHKTVMDNDLVGVIMSMSEAAKKASR